MIERNAEIEKRAAADKELCGNYEQCFTTKDGEAVLSDLCDRFGVFTGGIPSNSTDMAYNQGMRDAVLYILNRMDNAKRDPLKRFRRMLSERNDRVTENGY